MNPSGRRRDLAEAVWRVIRRDGLDRASVRTVAREAGVSMGSLRHYFGSQSELMVFSMRLVIERIQQRLDILTLPPDPLNAAQQVLAELLPVDEERQAEAEVWLAFTARAIVDPQLRQLRREAYELLRAGCRRRVAPLMPEATDKVIDMETERLFALLDGLAVHGVMNPERATAQHQLAVLDLHLNQITRAS